MNRRSLKNFLAKRSTMWTLSLCMTGAIVLGGIAAVDNVRNADDAQLESELGDTAYLDQEDEDELFYTLDDDLEGNMSEDGVAVNADGTASDGDAAGTEYITMEDGTSNADNSLLGENAANEDGNAEETTITASADGSLNNSSSGTAAEEAASSSIISEQALLEAGISFREEDSLVWPSAGTILIDYSMDSSVYFPTLNQYKYNPALILGSEVGNQVLASAKGIVESVDIEDETGTTLVLNIGNGYKLTYGQLKELAVVQGDAVEAGAVIGYVSEPTKYYSTEGSNLYFKMTQDGTPVDPVLYLE